MKLKVQSSIESISFKFFILYASFSPVPFSYFSCGVLDTFISPFGLQNTPRSESLSFLLLLSLISSKHRFQVTSAFIDRRILRKIYSHGATLPCYANLLRLFSLALPDLLSCSSLSLFFSLLCPGTSTQLQQFSYPASHAA